MTRLYATHLIFSLLFLLSTSRWVNCCCSAFLPRLSIIGHHHYRKALFLQDSSSNGVSGEKNERSLLEQKLREHFERLSSDEARCRAPSSNDHNSETYLIREIFMEEDFYWKSKVRTARLRATLRKGCLYRPKIVEDLYAEVMEALNDEAPCGIMVKGPQGIGKSHTLVNLVRKLLYGTNGKYLVTFIPDCEYFERATHLSRAICASFGTTPTEVGYANLNVPDDLEEFIASVDSVLKDMDKQWIFIYDQINRIFARPEFEKVKDLGTISFPFSFIKKAMEPGRITSIISASANNELAYKERHEGFEEYYHPISMNWNDLQMLYPSLADKNKDLIMSVTGGVPLQVSNLIDVNFDVKRYEKLEKRAIRVSLLDLKKNAHPVTYANIIRSAIACLLGIAGDDADYEKKYSVPRQGETDYYDPVYPLVSTVYREFFWDDIMHFVTSSEKMLLGTCMYSQTTNDVRGRLFEIIVINRCVGRDLRLLPTEHDDVITEAEFPGLLTCQLIARFPTNDLPPFETMREDGMYVPENPNFPAIDIIWKMGNITWFVKIHVSNKTTNQLRTLKKMCKDAGWQGKMYLLYLSPEKKVTELLPRSYLSSEQEPDIVVKALSIEHISCLSDIPWPEGCSLDGNSKASAANKVADSS